MSSSDSEAPEADPAGGSEDDEVRGVMAVTAVTATAASDRMESDSDSDKSSDNSGLKRKAAALKVGEGRGGAGAPGLGGGGEASHSLALPPPPRGLGILHSLSCLLVFNTRFHSDLLFIFICYSFTCVILLTFIILPSRYYRFRFVDYHLGGRLCASLAWLL